MSKTCLVIIVRSVVRHVVSRHRHNQSEFYLARHDQADQSRGERSMIQRDTLSPLHHHLAHNDKTPDWGYED